jgi:hypothetical protein
MPYPDAPRVAGHIASLYGLRGIVDAGLAWSPELGLRYGKLRVTGVTAPGLAAVEPARYEFGNPIDLLDPAAARKLARIDASRTGLLVSGPATRLCGPDGVLERLASLVAAAPLIVVATDDAAAVRAEMASRGLQPELAGSTRARSDSDDRSGGLLIYDRALARVRETAGPAPSDFKVVAILAVYNEQDVVGPTIQKLLDDGVGVYVVDDWSTDRTYEIVRGFDGRGLVGHERFPATAGNVFALSEQLRRIEAIPAELEADWYVHADADERRSGPWPGVTLREALWLADRSGFNAVDHTVINYCPIDNGFPPGSDYESYFRYFELGRTADLLVQIKAWKNVGRVDLASSGGHQAEFPGKRVFPYKFLLKHYPIRSQSHGEQKIFRDRRTRWDARERARGWHHQYDRVAQKQSFLRDPHDLIEDKGEATRELYLGEMITGAGLFTSRLPGWAMGGSARRALYLRSRPITRSRPYQGMRGLLVKQLRRLRRAGAQHG